MQLTPSEASLKDGLDDVASVLWFLADAMRLAAYGRSEREPGFSKEGFAGLECVIKSCLSSLETSENV